jgi:hypothetical protein
MCVVPAASLGATTPALLPDYRLMIFPSLIWKTEIDVAVPYPPLGPTARTVREHS